MALSVPRLETCCCGCTLRTGTLILLYLSVFGMVCGMFGNPAHMPSHGKDEINVTKYSAGYKGYAILSAIVSVIALYGAHSDTAWALMPYIVLNAIALVILPIAIFIFLFVLFPVAFILLFLFLLGGYFWLVIYNFKRELEERKVSSPA